MLSGGNRTGLKELEIVAAAWCWVSEFLVEDLAMLLLAVCCFAGRRLFLLCFPCECVYDQQWKLGESRQKSQQSDDQPEDTNSTVNLWEQSFIEYICYLS